VLKLYSSKSKEGPVEAWTIITWFPDIEMRGIGDYDDRASIAYKISGIGGDALGRSKPPPGLGIGLDSADDVVQGQGVQKIALIHQPGGVECSTLCEVLGCIDNVVVDVGDR
jgi:hypothetical protein